MSDELEGGSFSVVEGRDGWLFLGTYDDLNVMQLYTDPCALPPSVYEAWRSTLQRRREYFEQCDTVYLTLVVPDTCVVYPDKLPLDTELTALSPYQRLEALLDEPTRAQCLYLLDDLVAGCETHDTFQSKDSHWTDWGAYLGYRATIHALSARLPNIGVLEEDRIDWSTRRSFGALGVVMDPEQSEMLRVGRVRDSQCRATRTVSTDVRDGYMVVEQDRPELPTAVIFRDSFMTNAHKFFSESFRRTVYVSHPNRMFFDLLDDEQPDVVIFQTVERRLCVAPNEPSVLDFRMMFGDLQMDEADAVAAQVSSRSLLRTGDLVGALAANDEALTLAPPNARLLLHRSQLLAQLQQPLAALEALRTAATLAPQDAPVSYILAQSLRARGLLDEAFAAGRRATELEPRHAVFWPFAITTAIEAGDNQAAIMLATQALHHHPQDPDVLWARSRALVGAGDLERAEASVREALAASPGTALYLGQLASVLIQRSDWPAARDCLSELQRVDADTAPALATYVELVDEHLAGQQ